MNLYTWVEKTERFYFFSFTSNENWTMILRFSLWFPRLSQEPNRREPKTSCESRLLIALSANSNQNQKKSSGLMQNWRLREIKDGNHNDDSCRQKCPFVEREKEANENGVREEEECPIRLKCNFQSSASSWNKRKEKRIELAYFIYLLFIYWLIILMLSGVWLW